MLVAMAGAMSTAELGVSLAEMIRRGKVHAISCTGANLEEDIFNLVARDHYKRIPRYRELTRQGRAGSARPSPQPRHRHVHSRRGSDAPHRAHRRRALGGGRQGGEARAAARVPVRDPARRQPEAVLPDRSEGQLDDRGGRTEAADLRAGLGGFDARQRLRGLVHQRQGGEADDDARRHRVHDRTDEVVRARVRRRSRSASSRSAAASPATSRSASCR